MASGESIGNAYLNVIPKLASDGVSSVANQATSGLASAATSAGEGFGSNLLAGMKGPLLGAGAAIAGAMGIKAIADGLLGIGETFDTMKDTIIVGTGASGEALEALAESAKGIATSVPTSFEAAGDIVQNLNTRMGLVGDELEDVGQRVAAMSNLFGSDINLDTLTGAMNAFGVANEDVSEKMDYLFNVGQATGISFDELTGIIEKNAPALQNLGFSLEESANMAGLLDKAGMDANGVMSKMSKALVEIAKPGESAADAYRNIITEMQGFIEEGNTAAALDIASTVFGTRGAAQFVGALQSGALSMEDLENAALGAGDGIMGALERTMSWNERLDILKNKVTEALEPLGSAFFDAAGAGVAGLTTAFDTFQEVFSGVSEAIAPSMEALNEAFGAIGAAFDEVFGQASATLGEEFSPSIAGLVELISSALIPIIQALADFIVNNVVPAIGVMGEFVNTYLVPSLISLYEWFNAHVLPALQVVAEFILNNVLPAIGDLAGYIVSNVVPAIGELYRWFADNIAPILGHVAAIILDNVVPALTRIAGFVIDNVVPVLKQLAGIIMDNVAPAFTGVAGFVSDNVIPTLKQLSEWISYHVVPVFETLGNIVSSVSGWIGDLSNQISWATGSVGSFLGSIQLPSFSFHAAGGWVDSPTAIDIAGERGGEFVWPSYGPYLDKYADALSARMGGGGVTISGNQFTVREDADIERIGRELVNQWSRKQKVNRWA